MTLIEIDHVQHGQADEFVTLIDEGAVAVVVERVARIGLVH
jgi:hypothetical protein